MVTAREHVAHETTGSAARGGGHASVSCVALSRFSSMARCPFAISLRGNTRRWLAKRIHAQSAMNHFVGSYWYQRTALR